MADQEKRPDTPARVAYCPTCGGSGKTVQPRAYLEGTWISSIWAPQKCPACKGEGKFKNIGGLA